MHMLIIFFFGLCVTTEAIFGDIFALVLPMTMSNRATVLTLNNIKYTYMRPTLTKINPTQ